MKKAFVILFLCCFLFANNVQLLYFLPSEMIASPSAEEAYRIENGDVLEVVVLGEEDLSKTVIVMYNGMISFPLIGEVKVVGLTLDESVDLLSERLKKYFTHPVVSIILKSPTVPYVSVFGEVLKQGAIEYQRGLRITDYLALAGGPTASANLGKVKVVRFQTGEPVAKVINIAEILKKGRTANNLELKSGDWIYVSRKFTFPLGTVIQILTLAVTGLNLYLTVHALY